MTTNGGALDKGDQSKDIRYALMSDYTYGEEGFGEALHFTNHIGVECAFMENMSTMARVQHMSNAGIYSSNPGVNLVMVGLRYQF